VKKRSVLAIIKLKSTNFILLLQNYPIRTLYIFRLFQFRLKHIKYYIFIYTDAQDFLKISTRPKFRVKRVRDNGSRLYLIQCFFYWLFLDYKYKAPTPKSSNHNLVYTGYSVPIGCFWTTSTKLLLQNHPIWTLYILNSMFLIGCNLDYKYKDYPIRTLYILDTFFWLVEYKYKTF